MDFDTVYGDISDECQEADLISARFELIRLQRRLYRRSRESFRPQWFVIKEYLEIIVI